MEARDTLRSLWPLSPAFARLLLIAVVLLAWELASKLGFVDHFTAPAPTAIGQGLVEIVAEPEFLGHLARTISTFLISLTLALVSGIACGIALWKFDLVGRAVEPYLISFRALPTLVFYPILLAILGLNAGPIIAIATAMAFIPVALFTMLALRSVSPTLTKLGDSLVMSPGQRWHKIIIPAATPLAFPGIKQGVTYALLATTAMEFILSSRGLGFRIGLSYLRFEVEAMYAYLAVVIALSVSVYAIVSRVENIMRRDML